MTSELHSYLRWLERKRSVEVIRGVYGAPLYMTPGRTIHFNLHHKSTGDRLKYFNAVIRVERSRETASGDL